MIIRSDNWRVVISQEEMEQFIKAKTGQDFPDCYFESVRVNDGFIIIDVVAE